MTSNSESMEDIRARAIQLNHLHTQIVIDAQRKYDRVSDFTFEKDEVFIVSFMKSGTTLTQQMLYQLLVITGHVPTDPNGEEFHDISAVVPFVEARNPTKCYKSIHDYHPKAWKSHADATQFSAFDPSKGKFICCVRNGLNIAPSFLDFTFDWIMPQAIEDERLRQEILQQFFITFLGMSCSENGEYTQTDKHIGSWFKHLKSWIQSDKENILFVIYEDTIVDMKKTVRMIANFLDIPVNDQQIEWVVKKCDRETMAKDNRFEDRLISDMFGWDSSKSTRVRSADAKGFKQVPLRQESINMYWTLFEQTFGLKSYEELVKVLREKNIQFYEKQ